MTDVVPSLSGYIDVDGGRLPYDVTGTGFPLVLIHAGVADSTMWDDQVSAFSSRYRVIRYDTRGFGRATTADVSFSNRNDLADLLDQLGVQRAYLLGLSRGGAIALDFTLEYPDRVAALILAASAVSGFDLPPEQIPAEEMALFDQMEQLSEQGDLDALNELEVRVWVDGPGQPETRVPAPIRDRVRAMNADNFAHIHEKTVPRPLEPAAAGRLAEVRVPALVLIGDLDTTDMQAAAQALVEGIAGARKVLFPGVAHMINLERPAEFNDAVLSFLEEVDQRKA